MSRSHLGPASRRVRSLLAAAALMGGSVVSSTATEAAVEPHYVALDAPARLADTRPGETTIDGQHAGTGLVPADSTVVVRVAGRAGIPTDAHAVVLNVTAVTPLAAGHLTVHPTGTTRPTASNLNYSAGQVIANTVIARLGTDGDVSIHTHAATHLVVDIAGHLPTDTYTPLPTPRRLADTRPGETTIDGQHAGTGLVPSGGSLQLQIAGRAGIPTDAHAVVLNVTAVTPLAAGHLTVHPTGTTRPTASNLNYSAGQVIANTVIARVGAGGAACAFTHTTSHLVVDVAGYLTGPEPPPAGPSCPPVAYGEPQPLGGGATVADINNAGIVVGTDYHGSAADSDAVWWPTLAGGPQLVPYVPDARSSNALAVNDRNQVLVSTYADARGTEHFVIDLASGSTSILPRLEDVPALGAVDVSRVTAIGLNDRSEVVLNLVQGDHDPDGAIAIWNAASGAVATHPELLDVAWAYDISDLGQVVGSVGGRPFSWDLDTNDLHWLDLGAFSAGWAKGVNDRGQIIGSVIADSDEVPSVIWSDRDAAPATIPGPSPSVRGINDAGLVWGTTLPPGSTWPPPGVWDSASGEWLDFPMQEGHSIHAMNDLGQVVGLVGDEQPAIWQPI